MKLFEMVMFAVLVQSCELHDRIKVELARTGEVKDTHLEQEPNAVDMEDFSAVTLECLPH
ncbi:hypothetical protein CA260_12995 [Dyella jiangningensis]|uniref:Uncharacterized protein n=1 Tax=Dyella jiangningensis TaxID=1379159 RepID=A0A328NYT8_9GAMM|nr:hypothetical protein CA260_12995 [Dyella jiangningensis]